MFSNLRRWFRKASKPAVRPSHTRLEIDKLEDRSLMTTASLANGVLSVFGTESADTIRVRKISDSVSVENTNISFNGSSYSSLGSWRVTSINVYGYGGADYIDCESGNKSGQQFHTVPITIEGGAGDDKAWGSSGDDYLYGREGNDSLYGLKGNDHLYGGDDNDYLFGGGGTNLLSGNAGNDTIKGWIGADRVYGGTGNDTFNLTLYFDDLANFKGKTSFKLSDYANFDQGKDTFNLSLDADRLAEKFLDPLVRQVKRGVKFLKPVVDFLNKQVPILSKVYPGGLTFNELLWKAKKIDADPIIDAYNAIQALGNVGMAGNVKVGSFTIHGGSQSISTLSTSSVLSNLSSNTFGKMRTIGFSFPFLQEAKQILRIAMGEKVDLFKYSTPTLSAAFDFTKSKDIPTGLPLVSFKGTVGVHFNFSARATFGLDTTGLRTGNLLEGFYLQNARASASITLLGKGAASVGVSNVFSLAEAGVYGRGTGTLTVSLKDPNGDGKVYYAEVSSFGSSVNIKGSFTYDFGIYVKYRTATWINPSHWWETGYFKWVSKENRKSFVKGTLTF